MGIVRTLRSVLKFQGLEGDRTSRKLSRVASVEDLRLMAKRRMPEGCFDYIDGAAEDERAKARNAQAYADLGFKPRVLRDVSTIDPSTTVLGKPLAFPLALAPTGFGRIADPPGELAVAKAAERAGLPYTLSTLGTRSIEEVAAVNAARKWYQLYVFKDRGLVKDMLSRAEACNYEAIMITVDTAVLGKRDRDVRRGFTLPPKLGIGTLIDGARHPGWTWRFVRSDPIMFSNLQSVAGGDGSEAINLAQYVNTQFDLALSWTDLDWIRSVWPRAVIIKGIQTVEDAQLAADNGVDAIVLSNHGGRQLDSAPATLDLVAPVVDAVGDRIEVMCDGGVRRGSDIVKAVCLGAKAVLAGRAYLYGLGAAGERGVDKVLSMFEADVRRTMALLGAKDIASLSRELVDL